MSNAPRKLVQAMLALLATSLIAGCGRVTLLPAQQDSALAAANTPGVAAAPLQEYEPDDSTCRWSVPACVGDCGGGGGQELIEPIGGVADAVVSELAGNSPAFGPDGKLAATVDGETVRVWRAADGRPAYELAGDAFLFNPDGRTLAVHEAGEWYLWDLTAEEEQYRLAGAGGSLYFSADGGTIVADESSAGGPVRVYDAATGSELLAVEDVLSPTAISPDGTVLATTRFEEAGTVDFESIVLWDTATGAELLEMQAEIQSQMPLAGLRGHHSVDSLAFSPDGQALLSAGRDAVRLWDAASGEHLRCFQTPDHFGADSAFWGADGGTIMGIAANRQDICSCAQSFEQDVYVWDANTNHPVGMLGLGEEQDARPLRVAHGAESGSLLAWRVADVMAMRDRKALLWDLSSGKLLGILPTTGLLTEASLSPTGDRAVTVAMYEIAGDDDPEAIVTEWDTLLWDTQNDSLALTVQAQESYRNALKAAVDGKPAATQQRSLRRAQALSPELFGEIEQIGADEMAGYAAYLARTEMVEAIADAASPAAEDFYAELRATNPQWDEWPDAELEQQVTNYLTRYGWDGTDAASVLAAYEEFAAADQDRARAPKVIDSLLGALAPEASALAKAGDIEGATALLQETLSLYPELDVDAEIAVPRMYAQALVEESWYALWAGDAAGAIAMFGEALAFDPSLLAAPPHYVLEVCALGPELMGVDGAVDICTELDVNVAPIELDETAGAVLAPGATDFWSFDAPTAMAVTLDFVTESIELDPYLALDGPDGVTIAQYVPAGSDARVVITLPQAGRYLILVSSYSGNGGEYQFTVSEAEGEG